MGRFNHEAVAFDPASGCVYQTEDRDDGLLYRFLPHDRSRLAAGGRLQAFKACECKDGVDVRNWQERAVVQGELIPAEWVDLDDVEAPDDDLRRRGFARGATRFARGEGMWRGADGIYLACTSGGPRRRGQIFRYVPGPREGTPDEKTDAGMLELFAEPDDALRLDMGDNLTVAPWGELIVCEDGPGEQLLRLFDVRGEPQPLARNALNQSELAGAAFSPDGSTLFVNVMDPGITLAVTGPWPTAAT
jgi:secreted PhoX family phosphatase